MKGLTMIALLGGEQAKPASCYYIRRTSENWGQLFLNPLPINF